VASSTHTEKLSKSLLQMLTKICLCTQANAVLGRVELEASAARLAAAHSELEAARAEARQSAARAAAAEEARGAAETARDAAERARHQTEAEAQVDFLATRSVTAD